MPDLVVSDSLDDTVDELLDNLVAAWNAGDAGRYVTYFHPDVDFVDVLGRHLHGNAAVEDIHRRNFASIHLDSTLAMHRVRATPLGGDVGLAVTSSAIRVPAGPLAGHSTATQTLVLQRTDSGWRIRAFHNTFVREMPGVPPVHG
jgi:uncharacterized protein (TIGR02246 family)